MSTLMMPDSVNVNDLPVGFPAYLGYTDGDFRTANALRALFPDAELVLLTVDGTSVAHGARVAGGEDTEPGDLTAAAAADWLARALRLDPGPGQPDFRPVMYASVRGLPGYGMRELIGELGDRGIKRDQVRLLSAHYTDSPHICGPASCGAIDTDMDGTQWTNSYRTAAGALVDMSQLRGDFFGAVPPVPVPTETERLVRELGIVRQGDTGPAVRRVQGLLMAAGAPILMDGVFGPKTAAAMQMEQRHAGIEPDGVVGPLTWPVLLGVA